jgi:hypothetical protein
MNTLRNKGFFLLAIGILTLQAGLAEANLVLNGTFDSGLTDWAVIEFTGTEDVRVVSENGNNVLEQSHPASGWSWSSIRQEIASKLVVGQTYDLSFDFKGFSGLEWQGKFSDSLSIFHSTGINVSFSALHPLILDGAWHSYTIPFLVSSTHPRSDEPMLAFIDSQGGMTTTFLDNISIVETASIPEPSSLFLFGVGVAAFFGKAGRVRRTR